MGLDDKVIFPDFRELQVISKNEIVPYTREITGNIIEVLGNTVNGISVGILNQTTNKYDINIITKGYQNTAPMESTYTLTLDAPIRAIGEIRDKIRLFDSTWYLTRYIGENAEGNLYELPLNEVKDEMLSTFNPSIQFYGTSTEFTTDGEVLPILKLNVPTDYAYNVERNTNEGEHLTISQSNLDNERNIIVKTIEGQTYENLLTKPLSEGNVSVPVDLQGENIEITDWICDSTASIRETQGNTFVNLLEDKVASTTLKPVVKSYGRIIETDEKIMDLNISDWSEIGYCINSNGVVMAYTGCRYSKHIEIKTNATFTCPNPHSSEIAFYTVCEYDINKKFIKANFNTKINSNGIWVDSNKNIFKVGGTTKFIVFSTRSEVFFTSSIHLKFDGNVYNKEDKIKIDKISGELLQGIMSEVTTESIYKAIKTCGMDNTVRLNSNDTLTVTMAGLPSSPTFDPNTEWITLIPNEKYVYECERLGSGQSVMASIYGSDGIRFASVDRGGVFTAPSDGKIFLYTDGSQGGQLRIKLIKEKDYNLFNTHLRSSIDTMNPVGEIYLDDQQNPILDNDGNEQYKIDVVQNSKNLWDGKSFLVGRMSNGLIELGYTSNEALCEPYGVTWTITGSSMRGVTLDNISCIPDKDLTFSFNYSHYATMQNSGVWFNFFDLMGSYIMMSGDTTAVKIGDRVSFTVKVPPKAHYVKICYHCGSDTNNASKVMKMTNILVEHATADSGFATQSQKKITFIVPQQLYDKSDFIYWDTTKNKYCIQYRPKTRLVIDRARVDAIKEDKFKVVSVKDKTVLFELYGKVINIEGGNYQGVWADVNLWSNYGVRDTWYNVDTDSIGGKLCVAYSLSYGGYFQNIKISIHKSKLNTYDLNGVLELLDKTPIVVTYQNTIEPVIEELTIFEDGAIFKNEEDIFTISEISKKGTIYISTLPFSNNAYIKPNTKYTLMMENASDVNYNLGGLEGIFPANTRKKLITTPSSITDFRLLLNGEGLVQNLTLLEDDKTNSVLPSKFIDDVLSVGDYDATTGKYKVKIVCNSVVQEVLLPCQLMAVDGIADRLYWDETRGKMCIDKMTWVDSIGNLTLTGGSANSDGSFLGWGDIYTTRGHTVKSYTSKYQFYTTLPYNIKIEMYNRGAKSEINFTISNCKTIEEANQVLERISSMKIYYILKTSEIIETDITAPIQVDLNVGTNIITTLETTVKPNLWVYDLGLERPCKIAPNTTYYITADTENDIDINVGGSVIRYLSTDTHKSVTTPTTIDRNTARFTGSGYIRNVMLRSDSRQDLIYFNGIQKAGVRQLDGKYKIDIISKDSNSAILETKSIIMDNPLGAGEFVECGNFTTINTSKIESVSGIIKPLIKTFVPYKVPRKLLTPRNISFNDYTNNDTHTFTWTTDVGVEGHKFYYKGNLINTSTTPFPSYTYHEELEGLVEVVAYNTLGESDRASKSIKTLPNRSEIIKLESQYNNGYKFVITFNDNSNIKVGYKFIYSIDDGEEITIDIPVPDKAVALSQNIDIADVKKYMKVRVNPYNSVGQAIMPNKTFHLTPAPRWSYLASSENTMFRITDNFNFTTDYTLKTRESNLTEGVWNSHSYGTNGGIQGLLIDYLLPTNPEKEFNGYLVMSDGKFNHIPCKPFRFSKTLDLSLIAPSNFTMEWLSEGVAKFSWDDTYTNEDYFEFTYSLNGGIEETLRIDPTDIVGTGNRMSYTYNFAQYGVLTAKVRMVWELNTSSYTDSKSATYVAVSGLPPSWIIKKYNDKGLLLTWEAQSYVDHYEIRIDNDGVIEIVDVKQDMFYLDLEKYMGKNVNISIKTHFTTGVVTEYSNSIIFKPITTQGTRNEAICSSIDVRKNNNVRIYSKINEVYIPYQRVVGIIRNENLLNSKFGKDMLQQYASIYGTFYYALNRKYDNLVSIKTDDVTSRATINVMSYTGIKDDGKLNTFIYTPIQSKFTDFINIQRVTIVCIGDSITAG